MFIRFQLFTDISFLESKLSIFNLILNILGIFISQDRRRETKNSNLINYRFPEKRILREQSSISGNKTFLYLWTPYTIWKPSLEMSFDIINNLESKFNSRLILARLQRYQWHKEVFEINFIIRIILHKTLPPTSPLSRWECLRLWRSKVATNELPN